MENAWKVAKADAEAKQKHLDRIRVAVNGFNAAILDDKPFGGGFIGGIASGIAGAHPVTINSKEVK